MRNRGRTARAVLLALLASATLISAPGGAQPADSWALLNDSPSYLFTGGAPVRNPPLAVATLSGSKTGKGLKLTLTNIVSFTPDETEMSARIGFYPAPTAKQQVTWGVELAYRGDGTVDGTVVERVTEGSATASETWAPVDDDFADVAIRYAGEFAGIRIAASDAYASVVRDPSTAIGFDLWTGDPGRNVQPSARVSIGDLTGTKPGLLALQGTGIAADGSPQPWITRPVDSQLFDIRGRVSARVDGDQATIDGGRYLDHATQVRVFLANPVEPLPAGSRFPGYDLMLFGPDDASAPVRQGDAFASTEVGTIGIIRSIDELALELYTAYRNVDASVQLVVPGELDQVLLATGTQNRF